MSTSQPRQRLQVTLFDETAEYLRREIAAGRSAASTVDLAVLILRTIKTANIGTDIEFVDGGRVYEITSRQNQMINLDGRQSRRAKRGARS